MGIRYNLLYYIASRGSSALLLDSSAFLGWNRRNLDEFWLLLNVMTHFFCVWPLSICFLLLSTAINSFQVTRSVSRTKRPTFFNPTSSFRSETPAMTANKRFSIRKMKISILGSSLNDPEAFFYITKLQNGFESSHNFSTWNILYSVSIWKKKVFDIRFFSVVIRLLWGST